MAPVMSIAGRGRIFECDPRSTALIVVDMQYDFVDSAGACAIGGFKVAPLQATVPNVQALLELARLAGIAVAYTRYGFRPDLSDLPESVRRQSRDAGGEYGSMGPLGRIMVQGEPGHAILKELEPRREEVIFDKSTFGAFQSTSLEHFLHARGISHLWIAGVTTQCCVESTVREAVDRGFYVLTVDDACAAFDAALHEATLRAIESEGYLFGWIADTAAVRTAYDQWHGAQQASSLRDA